ncbi:hypothetical protein P3T37_002998 [Kitasatospora sp. MAA4]|uniref:hypothetical protein n=1 Tax=Kitasatospora sp. MAA4 TaxID=3035093 RepID=UPI00247540D5|nr:hypothetical protein [Kitasatospora sp. MAA4]MDH6133602.1 hypothetical protein [Kitasatospora sp. MAA4]
MLRASKSVRRIPGQLLLLIALLAGSTLPASAAGPTGGINPCVNQSVCIVVTSPGQSPGTGGGGSSGGSSGGSGGTQTCTWNGKQWPCWDPDLGFFDTSDGCYYSKSDPQPPPSDPAWAGNDPKTGAIYDKTCRDSAGGLNPEAPVWEAKEPGAAAPPPDPGVVAQIAIKKLQFVTPVPHTAPVGTALVGVPVWFWYDAPKGTPNAEVTGPQPQTAALAGISVTATAVLTDVQWDLGYHDPVTGTEVMLSCAGKGAGHPYEAGLEKNPPADACTQAYPRASPAAGYNLTVTESWAITSVLTGTDQVAWPELDLTVASNPLALKVNELQVLN